MTRTANSAIAALVVLFATGCPATSMYRTAEPVPAGTVQLGAGSAVGVIGDEEQDQSLPTGQLELQARYGISDELDVGAKLFVPGLELNATWRLFHGSHWSWAVLPSAAIVRVGESNLTPAALFLFGNAGLVASRPLGRKWVIGFGGFAGAGHFRPETGGTAHGVWLGSFLHMDYKLGRRWHFTPELGTYSVIDGEIPVTGGSITAGAAFRVDL